MASDAQPISTPGEQLASTKRSRKRNSIEADKRKPVAPIVLAVTHKQHSQRRQSSGADRHTAVGQHHTRLF